MKNYDRKNIAKVLIISLMIFAKETIQAQWNGTSPLTTTTNVGIGTSTPYSSTSNS